MTKNERYLILLADFHSALTSLEKALNEDISAFNATVQDLIQNGRIQKFEICAELAWKTAKFYLENELGVTESSPKQVYRALFTSKLINDTLLTALLTVVDDRNLLSHIYKEDYFKTIVTEIPNHFKQLNLLYTAIK